MISGLLSVDFRELWGVIAEILADPLSNLHAALLLLAAATLLVSILFGVALLIAMKPRKDEVYIDTYEVDQQPLLTQTVPARGTRRWLGGGILWLSLLAVWLLAGFMTSQPSVCTSCHTSLPHVVAAKGDSHKGQQCVSCHEPLGYPLSVVTGAPARVVHIITSFSKPSVDPYGQVRQTACLSCHKKTIKGTVSVESLGVRISHAEPMAAGAECIDCHRLTSGKIGPVAAGMDTCLSCHDEKTASSKCDLCHFEDVSVAVNRTDRTPASSSVLIATPDCGGCHDQKSCDSCHGIRLPHTNEFKQFTHARAYAENLWNGDGTLCQRCHSASRNPCSKCHSSAMPSHGPTLKESHKAADPSGSGCVGCHNTPTIKTRNFCVDLCHRPEGNGTLPIQ